jgi:hypothetical protein
MEKNTAVAYQEVMKSYDRRGINLDTEFMDSEDSIQERMIALLELQAGNTSKTFIKNNVEITKKGLDDYTPEHLKRSLKWYAKKRQINLSIRQSRYGLVSLSDNETETDKISYHLSLSHAQDQKYDMYKHIMKQTKVDYTKGGVQVSIWSRNELRTLAKRYLSGKTQVEIANELKVTERTVQRLYASIDSKILSLDLACNLSRVVMPTLKSETLLDNSVSVSAAGN